MSDGRDRSGFLLVALTAVVIAVAAGGYWHATTSGRAEARHRAEREAVEVIFPELVAELKQKAATELDSLNAHGSGSSGGDSRREWTAYVKTPKHGDVLNVKVSVEIEGSIQKSATGIRVETRGLLLDAVFVRRLSEELARRGLRIASSTP